jgi:hypothetical protein
VAGVSKLLQKLMENAQSVEISEEGLKQTVGRGAKRSELITHLILLSQ